MGDLNFKLRRQHVLHPHGRPRAVWDCLLVALITWILVSVPFELSFSELRPNTRKAMLTFDLAIDILFVIDIVLNFMTAIESDGKLHFSFRNIVRHYVRGWFVFDVVWTVPMYIVLAVPPWTPWPGISSQLAVTKPWLYPLFRCVRALRVFSLFRIRRRLEYSLRISSKVSSLGSFLFVVFALAHVFSCTFAYLAFGDEEHLSYALDSRTLEEDTPQTKYIASLYWSMMTMTTVGYGDLTIRSNLGRLFSIGAMAVGGGVFAYGITNVVALFQQLYVEETEHQHKMDQVNTFMHHRSLPRKLCDEVRANFFHLKKAAHEKKMHDHQLFQQMSRTIQSKVASKFCEDMMPHRMPFLVGCSAEFIHELYLNMEVRCFLPGEDIIRQDEFGTELHFLFVGHVVVFLGQVRVAAFGPNTSFGEFGIFNPRKPRLATIQAMDFCETHCMDRRMLLAVLVRHPFMLYSIKQLATLRSKKGLTLLHENGGKGRTLLQGLAAVWHLEGSVGLLPPGMTMEDAPLLSELMGPPPTQLGGMRGASVRSSIGMFGQQPRRKSVVTAELDSSSQWAPSSHVISQSDNITQHTSRRRKSVAEGIDDLHLGPLNARMTVVSLQKKPSDVAMQMANSKDPTPPGTPSTAPHAPPSLVMPIQLQAADPAVELHEDKRVTALVADVQEVLRSQRALEMKLQAVMEMLAASHHNRVENVV
ncbi:TPA: hypothetical protein N0F65_000005 [Lagenidium giganteum]|uniref:Cyclic nucleotide-binding domain-containing protein n=1 Tax=Lagenidium giganteum TaxID=4803 RepID=A0AAV2YL79_9STRA|nr:TPA: hypothetical protein N0F65_000005 [Lagenidium giganteum]